MADDDCPACKGKGKVQVTRKPGSRLAKTAPPLFVKCDDCGGSGKSKR